MYTHMHARLCIHESGQWKDWHAVARTCSSIVSRYRAPLIVKVSFLSVSH